MMDMKQRIRAMMAQIEKDIAAGWTAEDHYLEPLRIALAALEDEPDYYVVRRVFNDKFGPEVELDAYDTELDASKSRDDHGGIIQPVYLTPPAASQVPEDATPMLPVVAYYMRDNHTFLYLPKNTKDSISALHTEFGEGWGYGMLCSKDHCAPEPIHAKGDWEEFRHRAEVWLNMVFPAAPSPSTDK